MSGLGALIKLLFLKPQVTNQGYKTTYGTIFVISFVSSSLLILISLFGRKIKYNGIKWCTLNCSILNIIILLVRINNSNRSPWTNFMTKNIDDDLQDKIFCTCYGIHYFLGASYLVTYVVWCFLPDIEKKNLYKFVFWPVTIILVDGLGILSFFLNDLLVDDKNDPTYELAPLSMYHGISFIIYCITLLIFLIFAIIFFFYEFIKFYRYWKNQNISRKVQFQNEQMSIDVLIVGLMSIINFTMIYPGNSIIFGIFVADHWGEHFIQYKDFLFKALKTTKEFDDLFMVIAPIVNFLLTIIMIKKFRRNFVCIITCGRFYNSDLNNERDQWAKKVCDKIIVVKETIKV